jgi:hypothetical protein
MKTLTSFIAFGLLNVLLDSGPAWSGSVSHVWRDYDSGAIIAWGDNGSGECDVPDPNSGFVAADASFEWSAGLRTGGSIVAWGSNYYGQCDVPEPNEGFVAVSVGGLYGMGLRPDGSLVPWGLDEMNVFDIPEPNSGFVAVAAGGDFCLGLKFDGSIVGWGENWYGQCTPPPPNAGFAAISAGAHFTMGLKVDGTILVWGDDNWGIQNVPSPNSGFIAISAGNHHCLGLKSDGTVVAWGLNFDGECDVPEPNAGFTAVSAGIFHSLGLKEDGTIVAWGSNAAGQCDVPTTNEHFAGLAAGGYHSLGIIESLPTPVQVDVATAEVRGNDVLLSWRTPFDLRGVSFHVYRLDGDGSGAESELGERLTAVPLTSECGEYEFVDYSVRPGDHEYHLVMLGNGSAPVVVRVLPVRVDAPDRRLQVGLLRPNPTSGVATIGFETPDRGFVSLDLLDAAGRRIGRLAGAELDGGTHEMRFDLRHAASHERRLAAGIYCVVLQVDGRTVGKRLIVFAG